MGKQFVRAACWYNKQNPIMKSIVILGGGSAGLVIGIALAPVAGAIASAAGLGVAAGTLGGAAASSAGLAALGGGAIAAGGAGMAGGTAVVAAVGAAGGLGVAANIGRTLNKNGEVLNRSQEEVDKQQVNPYDFPFS